MNPEELRNKTYDLKEYRDSVKYPKASKAIEHVEEQGIDLRVKHPELYPNQSMIQHVVGQKGEEVHVEEVHSYRMDMASLRGDLFEVVDGLMAIAVLKIGLRFIQSPDFAYTTDRDGEVDPFYCVEADDFREGERCKVQCPYCQSI